MGHSHVKPAYTVILKLWFEVHLLHLCCLLEALAMHLQLLTYCFQNISTDFSLVANSVQVFRYFCVI